MDNLLLDYPLLGVFFGIACGLLLAAWWYGRKLGQVLVSEASLRSANDSLSGQLADLVSRNEALAGNLDQARSESIGYRERISQLQTSLTEQARQNEEKLALLEQASEQMNKEFKTIASEIFESRQKAYKEESKEQLSGLLGPLSERIKEFEKRVEDTYSRESRERFSLIKEVKNLQDLNTRISKDAINLTNALKGENKTQGAWGEVILERVLEKSGLQKGREYEVQVSMRNEEGRRRQPDVVVHLPEGKDVVIDAKVSLTAYERYSSAEDETAQQDALKHHVQSLRRHLKALGEKDYQQLDGVCTLDFVLLFVPVEAAFALAVQHDGEILSDAFENNIVIVSPSTLLATLRTIQNIWRYEHQNRNAQEIAGRAGALYDKFVNFVGDLETIGTRINSAQTAYSDAHNKLVSGKGSLVKRAEGMRELGAKVSKSLPKNLVEMPVRDVNIIANKQK
jgi:DNA recombination protein RmuC